MYNIIPLHPLALDWEWVYQTIENSKEEAVKKHPWKAAVDFLYGEFGKGFFDTCGHNHPIYHKLTTNLLRIDDLVQFTKALKDLKEEEPNSYSVLIEKLKPRKKCQEEGIPFSDILGMFAGQGFKVKFLREVEGRRNADAELICSNSGASVFVEVSQLKQSAAQSSIQQQHRRLSDTFLLYGYDLPKACKQLQHLQGNEMERIITQIKAMKDSAARDQQFIAFEDEFIMMAVAHPSKLPELDEWCISKNIRRNAMDGLQVDYNDTRRLVNDRKMKAEIEQLPQDSPGFIFMPVSLLYFFSMDIPHMAVSIMDQLVDFPHCLGVVLYAPSVGSLFPEGLTEVYNTYRSIKTINGITRHLFFIGNPRFNQQLSPETQAKLKKCLV